MLLVLMERKACSFTWDMKAMHLEPKIKQGSIILISHLRLLAKNITEVPKILSQITLLNLTLYIKSCENKMLKVVYKY